MTIREPLPSAPSAQFRRKRLIEAAGERFRNAPVAPAARMWLKRAYHAALMMQTGGRGLSCVLPQGERVRALPEYRHLSWNPTEYAAFRSVVRPGMVALDVGANVGAYSILLGQWVGPTGTVFAFEPAPEPFEGLVRHIELNRLGAVVHPVHSAVGASQAKGALLIMGAAFLWGTTGVISKITYAQTNVGPISLAFYRLVFAVPILSFLIVMKGYRISITRREVVLFAGFGFGGGSASAVVDVCVATHMRGLVPHDRVCEMRSGAAL